MPPEVIQDQRSREFWDRRYSTFALSESGWLGAGERLNHRLYACKQQALRRTLAELGLAAGGNWSVFDAGCGQGHFARYYRQAFPDVSYVGLDISERVVEHLRREMPRAEFHFGDVCEWIDPVGRTFDMVQSFDVLNMILDDGALLRALTNLVGRVKPSGALVVTELLPEVTTEPNGYLRHRSRAFWESALSALGMRIVTERPMYYWLPAGGPTNKYLRYAMTRLGPDVLYAVDRAAFAARLPRPASVSIDCRMRLLTIQRA